jgi:hypothetical protein
MKRTVGPCERVGERGVKVVEESGTAVCDAAERTQDTINDATRDVERPAV